MAKFAAVNTKVKALKGKMLTNKDYENLMHQNSVEEIATYLKQHTDYSGILKDVDTSTIHRGNLELYLKKHMIIQYEKLVHFFTGEYRKLFKILFMRFEIEDMKLYIRSLIRGEDLKNIKDLILYSGIYSTIDHEKLLKSKDIGGFVEDLKGTIYYPILKPYLEEEKSKLSFYLEMNLDRLYFTTLYEQISKLSGRDQRVLKEIFGKNIDLLNLEWIYRGLKYFDLSSEELVNYALKGGAKINYDFIKDLSYTKKEDEIIEKISHTPYNFLFDHRKTRDLFMERRMERYLYYQFLNYFNKGNMDITIGMAYLHLLEYEIKDIIAITETIRYNLNKEKIAPYLIRSLKGSV